MTNMSLGPGARAPDLVKVVEGGTVLVQLLLADALGITRQDLVLDLVDGPGDGGEQLLPADTEVLPRGREGGGETRCYRASSNVLRRSTVTSMCAMPKTIFNYSTLL